MTRATTEAVARIICRIVRQNQPGEFSEGYTMDDEVENAWDLFVPEANTILEALSAPLGHDELSGNPGELKTPPTSTAQACLRMAEDRGLSIPPAVRFILRLAHDEIEGLAQPGSDGAGEAMWRALNTISGLSNAGNFSITNDAAHGILQRIETIADNALASTPAIREGGANDDPRS